ncbi:MAG TPA: bifunctional glutamate N-acetyltransferase/amino-acid acetyltransferase ArgJ [Kiritimatiellia bacterium]|nr:bifunctional glutamate N-acetyltransferase/amino-acid acetyltransferase ArgJ [Kiritimatiellia bacterium]HRZ13382.1 bifunctional glutamate N-acetyltransferase/amino-acid acetyltransferase ArgJ [Kiritimatiellia bacterium]HSA18978.1 bifunctional glutamate N-acetyltransferase/amino-acid acetyltransferase ArgJ [Kiritimatiellia bacterium]
MTGTKKIAWADEIALPRGFRASGVAAGLKKDSRKDMALIVSDRPAAVAATFTTNQVQAATVKLCRARLACRTGRGVIVNSGNANACTGAQGLKDAERMAQLTGELAGIPPEQVFVSSTGRIGVQLPMDKIEAGIRAAVPALSAEGGTDASLAIMTTDTRPKRVTARLDVDGKPVILSALAKGSGMIEPNMATMLAYILTDAAVEAGALQSCLSAAVEQSFNRITVDGDRSTNDTVLFFANGAAGNRPLDAAHPDWKTFEHAVRELTLKLALKMVEDGEGVSKVVTVRVLGAKTAQDAEWAARSVANSLLVKTSWAGEYPNWGRVMDALGYSRARVEEDKVDITYDQLPACRGGLYAGTTIDDLKRIVRQKAFTLTIHLNLGAGETVVYTCNCTEEYVRINM